MKNILSKRLSKRITCENYDTESWEHSDALMAIGQLYLFIKYVGFHSVSKAILHFDVKNVFRTFTPVQTIKSS